MSDEIVNGEAVDSGATATLEAPAEKKPRKPRKPKVPKENYRAEGAGKLTTVPEDFSSKRHNPLKPGDFEDEAVYFDFKAAQTAKASANWARKAKEARELGGPEARKSRAKLLKLSEAIEKMRAEMAASGIDPDAVLATMREAQGV